MAHGLTVRPGAVLRGAFAPPGDKSITHRAYLLGLVNAGALRVTGANPGQDCAATLRCAELLGARVAGGALHGAGPDLVEPDRVLDCGNSGTTLRLLAGLLAAQPFLAILAGDASLHRRPVDRIVEPLRRMGATLTARRNDTLPPLAVSGAALVGVDHRVPVASAQVASCVLLAGLFARGTTSVTLPGPARDHTERMLAGLGVPVEREELPGGGRRVAVRGPVAIRTDLDFEVPGDASAAAFFLAAAAATPGAEVVARGVGLNPTRTGLLDVLEAMGARVERRPGANRMGEEAGDVRVEGPDALRAIDVPPEWVPRMIDEVPAWAVAASAARGRSRLSGAAELRVKESDRIAALAEGLGRLGLACVERPDGLEIEGGPIQGGTVSAHGDHRIAMALAVLGVRARSPVAVDDARSVATSYPGFATTLKALGAEVEEGGA